MFDIDDARNAHDNEMIDRLHGDDNDSYEDRYERECTMSDWENDAKWADED